MKSEWEEAPLVVPRLNIRWLLQETTNGERSSTPEDAVTSTTALLDEVEILLISVVPTFTVIKLVNLYFTEQDSQESSSGNPAVSKWELMEQTGEKLGNIFKIEKLNHFNTQMLSYWTCNHCRSA